MKNCSNCGIKLGEKYCSNCGDLLEYKRIDGHYILHEFLHILHFENGFFNTLKELLLRPGQNIKVFITGNRNRLIKPIVFIIITSLIYTVTEHFFHIEGYIKFDSSDDRKVSSMSAVIMIFTWIQNHYGYVNIIIGLFISFWLKIFFKKHNYNFFEILILFCFVMGVGMLLFSVFATFEGLTGLHVMQISSFIFVVYYTWSIGQFFDRKKIFSYVKAFFSYVLGVLTFVFSAFLLGSGIDYFINL
jgi:hypothetical protein